MGRKSASESADDLRVTETLSKLTVGRVLMRWLIEECGRRGLEFKELTKIMGISKSYLLSLRYGQRDLDGLSRDIIENLANFLNTDPLTIMLASEKFDPLDFYRSSGETLESEANRAAHFISNDPKWGALMPEIHEMDLKTKLYLIVAYEKAENKILMSSRINAAEIAKAVAGDAEEIEAAIKRLRPEVSPKTRK